jgi:hypothetical protein
MSARHVVRTVQDVTVILTLVVLIWYTIETDRLRKAAKDQVAAAKTQNAIASENALRPVVVLGSQDDLPKGIHELVIRNVGSGPALNTVTGEIHLHSGAGGDIIKLVHRTALAPNETQGVNDLNPPESTKDKLSPVARLAARIGSETVHVCIAYDNANREHYETWQTLYLPKSKDGYLPLDYLAMDFTCFRKTTTKPCSEPMETACRKK